MKAKVTKEFLLPLMSIVVAGVLVSVIMFFGSSTLWTTSDSIFVLQGDDAQKVHDKAMLG